MYDKTKATEITKILNGTLVLPTPDRITAAEQTPSVTILATIPYKGLIRRLTLHCEH